MTFVNVRRIERKATDLLRAFSVNQGWEFSLPVPVEQIIEAEIGYSICCDDFGNPKILGAISPSEKMIYTNELAELHFQKYPGSYQFTLGHETGHWALHLDTTGDGISKHLFICKEERRKPLHEREADQFAASLLMPEELVRKELFGTDYFNWPALYRLSEKWKVSITALRVRLEKLKMLYYCDERKAFFQSEAEAYGQLKLRLA